MVDTRVSDAIVYREIQLSDLESIFDVRVRTWHNPNGLDELRALGITPDTLRQLVASGSHRGFMAEIGGDVIGFAMGDRMASEMWVIAVLSQFEGRGIGRQLLQRVERWLADCGCRELWLTTDPDENYRAVGFYRRLGWEDWKMEDGDRFMRKRLDS